MVPRGGFTSSASFSSSTSVATDSIRIAQGRRTVARVHPGPVMIATVAVVRRSWLRYAYVFTAIVVTVRFAYTFPDDANHGYLELLAVLFIAGTNPLRADERGVCLAALRWLPLWVLFFSGLQKLFYGTYVEGEFLAHRIATDAPGEFEFVFRHLMSGPELDAIRNTGPEGPYRLTSGLAVVASNAVYVSELLAGALLAWSRTRTAGFVLALGILVGIEAGAREFLFGGFMTCLLLLYVDERWMRPGAVAVVLLYVYVLLGAMGSCPSARSTEGVGMIGESANERRGNARRNARAFARSRSRCASGRSYTGCSSSRSTSTRGSSAAPPCTAPRTISALRSSTRRRSHRGSSTIAPSAPKPGRR